MGWIVGAILAGCGSISSNLGVNIQKYSFVKNSQLDRLQQKKYIKQPLWLLGLILVSFGSLGDFIALSMAAQSIVAPIGSVTLVTNVLFAHFGLHEKLRVNDIIGTLMIICGSILSVIFGDHGSKQYSASDLTSLFFGTLFIVYVLLITLLLTVLHIFIARINPIRSKLYDTIRRWESVRHTDLQLATQLDIAIHTLETQYSRFERLHPFSLCATAGLYGSLAVLFGKMVAELLGSTISGINQMNEPITYIFALLMFIFVITQLHYMATALNSFDAMYCVPVFQCFFISGSTLGGACFFNEFNEFGLLQAIFFPIGLTCTLTGVVILSSRQMQLKRTVLPVSTQKLSNKHKRKHSNGYMNTNGQYTQLDDTAYIDDGVDNDNLDVINETDELSRMSTIHSDTELDTHDTELTTANTQDPEIPNTQLQTPANKQLLRNRPLQQQTSSIASRRSIKQPHTVQTNNKHRKYRESPSPGSAMELSYDTIAQRTPRTQYRPYRTVSNAKQTTLPRQRSYNERDPELVEPNSSNGMNSLTQSPETSHDHHLQYDDELMENEQLTERLKWMSSVGNVAGGLYGQLPLLGPLAQIILNAKNDRNNENEDTIATSLFGHQYHELDNNDSYTYENSVSNNNTTESTNSQVRRSSGDHNHYSSADIEMNDMQTQNTAVRQQSDDTYSIDINPATGDNSEMNTPATSPSNVIANRVMSGINQLTNVITGKSGYNIINAHDNSDNGNKSLTKALLSKDNPQNNSR